MFSGLVTVKIEKDNNFAKYIKLIREYDCSLSVSQIKKAIDDGEVVFSFDSENNPLVYDGKTNKDYFLESLFIRCLKSLKNAGAKMVVTAEDSEFVLKEYSTATGITTEHKKETNAAIMTEIENKWKLSDYYLEYLRTHPDNQYIESEDQETFEEIEICIFGANALIKGQEGYSYNPVEKTIIEDWNANLIVIAHSNADPYCIDISKPNSPVLHAMHGMGEWDFEEYCDSLESFFKLLDI